MPKICHALVAKTAKEITAAVWEELSYNDDFHRAYPQVEIFVRRQWKNFIGHARASLICILAHKPGTENNPDGPEYLYPKIMRDEVFECLRLEGEMKAKPQPITRGEDGRYIGGRVLN